MFGKVYLILKVILFGVLGRVGEVGDIATGRLQASPNNGTGELSNGMGLADTILQKLLARADSRRGC
jgi:hypothetical protein